MFDAFADQSQLVTSVVSPDLGDIRLGLSPKKLKGGFRK
jgi:hypothetical protein